MGDEVGALGIHAVSGGLRRIVGGWMFEQRGRPQPATVCPDVAGPWAGRVSVLRYRMRFPLFLLAAILCAAEPGQPISDMAKLPEVARARVTAWLEQHQHCAHDLTSLRVTPAGGVYVVCPLPSAAARAAAAAPVPGTGRAPVPIAVPPTYHSRLGSTRVIYLDFNGETVSGTQWNTSVATYRARPLSLDSDETTFNDAEQTLIRQVWERVAEDYAPFDVDVTTQPPVFFTPTTAQVLITREQDANGVAIPAANVGGVAFVGVFGAGNYDVYRPAWVNADGLGRREDFIAEAASHEVGHNLGLLHDGRGGSEYYEGHGTGQTSWGPLMGTGYDRDLSQWSRGDYNGATQTQDDLAIISAGLPYRADDAGDTAATALDAGTATTITGVIGRTGDVDYHAITLASGTAIITATPWRSGANTRGGNLDIALSLRSTADAVIEAADPAAATTAVVAASVTAGTYLIRITGAGTGSPSADPPSGYTAYGSLGAYTITIELATGPGTVGLAESTIAVAEDAGLYTVPVERTGGTTGTVSVEWSVNYGTAGAADASIGTGTITWLAGTAGVQEVTLSLFDDVVEEPDEQLLVTLSGLTGGANLGRSSALVEIIDDDDPGTVGWVASSATVSEAAATATVLIGRSDGLRGSIDVGWSVVAGSADAGDIVIASGTASWADGEDADQVVTLALVSDRVAENDETCTLVLSGATGGADLGATTLTLTITDDDRPGTLACAEVFTQVSEGAGQASVRITRTAGDLGAVGVTWEAIASSALIPDDAVVAAIGTFAWADMDSSDRTILIAIVDDTAIEADEQLLIELSNPTGGAVLTAASATIRIQDNDAPGGNGGGDSSGGGGGGGCGAGAAVAVLVPLSLLLLRRRRGRDHSPG
jgi:hypothetical protein